MRICGLDIETTGLSHETDHITELAWIIKDHGDPKPLAMQSHFVLPPTELLGTVDYITPEIARLTKITEAHLLTGHPLDAVLHKLAMDLVIYKVGGIVAHNGENFDRPFIRAKAKQLRCANADSVLATLDERLWIDTSVDCVYPEDCRYTNLLYVAAYFGILNPFPHAALFDVATMLKVLDQFPIMQVAERAKSPWVTVQARVSYEQRDLAKRRRYYWEQLGDVKYPKAWVKKVKECELEKEVKEAGFEVVKIA